MMFQEGSSASRSVDLNPCHTLIWGLGRIQEWIKTTGGRFHWMIFGRLLICHLPRCLQMVRILSGVDLGGGCRGCAPPWDDVRFSNTTGILQKKKAMWFIGVEVEQETSVPPPKKILDPPLLCSAWKKLEFWFVASHIDILRASSHISSCHLLREDCMISQKKVCIGG